MIRSKNVHSFCESDPMISGKMVKTGDLLTTPTSWKNFPLFVKPLTGASDYASHTFVLQTSGICASRGAMSDPETKDSRPTAPGCSAFSGTSLHQEYSKL